MWRIGNSGSSMGLLRRLGSALGPSWGRLVRSGGLLGGRLLQGLGGRLKRLITPKFLSGPRRGKPHSDFSCMFHNPL